MVFCGSKLAQPVVQSVVPKAPLKVSFVKKASAAFPSQIASFKRADVDCGKSEGAVRLKLAEFNNNSAVVVTTVFLNATVLKNAVACASVTPVAPRSPRIGVI